MKKRLDRHHQGRVSSTKNGRPWELVLQVEFKTRSEAMLLEKRIKKRGAKRYLDNYFGV
ncbi:GIY-YIG nuclease family protein [Jejuia pallidilutea]|uniref:GIY-YIG nuclease family protein n=1 Tax=Jejuia pallidilutea TaxID=504487 RepID=UPI0034E2C1FA